jgi:hypothetical protein
MIPPIVILISIVLVGLYSSGLMSIGTTDDRTKRIAEAIARAEGFYVSGSLPQRNNNPGSLRIHGETDTISKFSTVEDGWSALYRQINLIFSRDSNYYTPEMSIEEFASIWTGGDNPGSWANTVSQALNVGPSTSLIEV